MTTEEKLAAIEALAEGTYRDTRGNAVHGTVVSPSELAWLIAEVRRLQTPAMFGKTILDMIETHCNRDDLPNEDEADGALNAWLRMRAARDEAIADKEREYARGRADERRDVCRWMSKFKWLVDDVPHIERGEHVEATDD